MHELQKFYSWLYTIPGMCPDIEVGQLDDYITRRQHQNKKADLHIVQDIVTKYHHRSTTCPDVEIGGVSDDIAHTVRNKLIQKIPFTEAEALALAYLWLKPRTLEQLWSVLSDNLCDSPFHEAYVRAMTDDFWGVPETLRQAVTSLKAEEYVTEGTDGVLCTTTKFPLPT